MSSNIAESEAAQQRVGRIESQLRMLWGFAALIGLGLVLSVVVPPDAIEAERFALLDANGTQRAMFRVRDGAPALILQDEAGRWRAILDLEAGGPRLALHAADGAPAITLESIDGASSVVLHGADGGPGIELQSGASAPRITLTDADGRRYEIAIPGRETSPTGR